MTGTHAAIPRSRWLLAHTTAVFAFLYLPIVVLILYSFNGQGVGGFPPASPHARLVSHPVRGWAHLGFGPQQPAGGFCGDGNLAGVWDSRGARA